VSSEIEACRHKATLKDFNEYMKEISGIFYMNNNIVLYNKEKQEK